MTLPLSAGWFAEVRARGFDDHAVVDAKKKVRRLKTMLRVERKCQKTMVRKQHRHMRRLTPDYEQLAVAQGEMEDCAIQMADYYKDQLDVDDLMSSDSAEIWTGIVQCGKDATEALKIIAGRDDLALRVATQHSQYIDQRMKQSGAIHIAESRLTCAKVNLETCAWHLDKKVVGARHRLNTQHFRDYFQAWGYERVFDDAVKPRVNELIQYGIRTL